MTFEGYWAEVEKVKMLPQMAISQLPGVLNKETKEKLMRMTPEETVKLLNIAIEEINHGSVESIDSLVRKRL